ncbi:MAG: hypothetical protein U9N31_09810 [Candidatus Marinimicrobia bacterium]|nr:hypothetical protein [Candidatus Neomarinimicrobiota bacterium]
MAKNKEKKKENHPEWEKLGFAGLILTALEKAGKKGKKKKKDHLIEKDYW